MAAETHTPDVATTPLPRLSVELLPELFDQVEQRSAGRKKQSPLVVDVDAGRLDLIMTPRIDAAG